MKSEKSESKRINPSFDINTYTQINNLAKKNNTTAAALIREWSLKGLTGELAVENLDLITQIIRKQLQSILVPEIDRLASLSAKTCIQATTALYLAIDVLDSLPPSKNLDTIAAYEMARKKAVMYLKNINYSTED